MTGHLNRMGKVAFRNNFGDPFADRMGAFNSDRFLDVLKMAKRDQRYHEAGQTDGEFAKSVFSKVGGEPTEWLMAIARTFQDLNSEVKVLAEKSDNLRLSLYRVNALIIRCNKVIL